MTTMNEAREIIIGRMQTVFGVNPTWVCPWYSDNELEAEASMPSAAAGDASTAFARLSIRETAGGQETLGAPGGRRFTRNGVAQLSVHAVTEHGPLKADELAKLYRDNFEGVTVDGVYFQNCQVQDLGVEGAWWRVNALAQFLFEERK